MAHPTCLTRITLPFNGPRTNTPIRGSTAIRMVDSFNGTGSKQKDDSPAMADSHRPKFCKPQCSRRQLFLSVSILAKCRTDMRWHNQCCEGHPMIRTPTRASHSRGRAGPGYGLPLAHNNRTLERSSRPPMLPTQGGAVISHRHGKAALRNQSSPKCDIMVRLDLTFA